MPPYTCFLSEPGRQRNPAQLVPETLMDVLFGGSSTKEARSALGGLGSIRRGQGDGSGAAGAVRTAAEETWTGGSCCSGGCSAFQKPARAGRKKHPGFSFLPPSVSCWCFPLTGPNQQPPSRNPGQRGQRSASWMGKEKNGPRKDNRLHEPCL